MNRLIIRFILSKDLNLVSKPANHLRLSASICGHFFISILLIFLPRISHAEFVPLKKDETKPCKLQLSQAQNIPHRCHIISDRTSSLEVWQERLAFDFGMLSFAEFTYLKTTYGGNYKSKSLVAYEPNKSYQLIDFLPPVIQALNNHRFIPEATVINYKDRELNKHLYMNCWGLVYEVLRAAKNPLAQPALFMGQGSIMLDLLRDNSHQLLTFDRPDPISTTITKPGDIILVMHKSSTGYEYLDHIAIAIDDGIYFEKAGTGADVPIRIIDEATLQKIWQPGVFRYEVRRLKQDAMLPHPQEVFGINVPKIQKEFSSLSRLPADIGNSTSIMWSEEDQNISTSSLFHLVNIVPTFLDSQGRQKLNSRLYQPLLGIRE